MRGKTALLLVLAMVWGLGFAEADEKIAAPNVPETEVGRMTTYRVLVSTDLGGDPDDIQSLFRLVHYSDILKVEGVTSCTGPGSPNPRAELIREWIRRVDVNHLRGRGHEDLMPETDLLAVVRQGAKTPGAPGVHRRTEGSDWIIARAHAKDPAGRGRPLWVLVWGSITDVAQALHDDPDIAPKIRVYSIGSSNTLNDPLSRDYVYDFMRKHCPGLWWVESGGPGPPRHTFRGVFLGGDQSGEWSNTQFIPRNIRGRGSTHGGMFKRRCGDVFPVAHWPANSLKEGDSPSTLYLLSPVIGGVGDVDDPTRESWGGRYRRPQPKRFPNYCTDLDAGEKECQATVARWRVQFLSHWKARWGRYADLR